MKYVLIFIIYIFTYSRSYSQDTNIKEAANQAIKVFTWDVEKTEKGSMMFLDVPYQRKAQDSIEYLSLTVAKSKSKKRPDFISVIVPSNIARSNGIFLKFANTVIKDGERRTQLEEANPIRLNFESCDNSDCKARIIDGYTVHEDGKKEDILSKFLTSDHVLFLLVYPDGSHKTIAIPLFTFKSQFETL